MRPALLPLGGGSRSRRGARERSPPHASSEPLFALTLILLLSALTHFAPPYVVASPVVLPSQSLPIIREPFDSNCITPGTEFMARLSAHLHFFVRKKQTEDAAWQRMRVILSGHDVRGEGEHKIMEHIRMARLQPDYAPNQRHCMYGLDADLIMLALVTHEPHFTLLREVVTFGAGGGQPSREARAAWCYCSPPSPLSAAEPACLSATAVATTHMPIRRAARPPVQSSGS